MKPAVLSSARCGHRFAEEPSTEDGDFEHHLTVISLKFLRAEHCEQLIMNSSSDNYTPVQNPGTLPVHRNWCPLKICCDSHPCPGSETTRSYWELLWGVRKSLPHSLASFNFPNLYTEMNPKRLRENLIITPGFPCWVTVLKSLLGKKQRPQGNKQEFSQFQGTAHPQLLLTCLEIKVLSGSRNHNKGSPPM